MSKETYLKKLNSSNDIKMCVFPLNNGTLKGMSENLICNGDETKNRDLPIWTVLIDHKDGKILFDTAMTRYIDPNMADIKDNQILPNTLNNMAIKLDDIDYVVCSHLHFDHSGYLDLFKNSKIIVEENEYKEVKRQFLESRLEQPYIYNDVKKWFTHDMKWIPIHQDSYQLADGIYVLNLGKGHAYGMLALLLQLQHDGNVILAGDIIYCRKNIEDSKLRQKAYIDKEAYHDAFDQLMKIAKKYNAKIWFGHDQEQFEELMKKAVFM